MTLTPKLTLKLTLFAALGLLATGPAIAAGRMPMDRPVTMNGITAVCTGIGDARNDPRWLAYPVRVEFSNSAQQYLAGAHVELSKAGGSTLASVDCSGSWVLFQLAPGDYKVAATLLDHPQAAGVSARFSPPANGQKRVVLEFKDLTANQ